ncbi:MAG: AzlD domain-containing protein [Solirubrobacterales bacterium]
MSAAWATVLAMAVATALIRASGPVLLGGRDMPAAVWRVVVLLAPALLAALVITQTLSDADGLALDERGAGVAAAGLSLLWRSSLLLAMAVAIAVTAVARLIL